LDYKTEFERKLVSADEAVKVVKSGDLVHYGEFMMNSHVLMLLWPSGKMN